jgi:hypothetical protein
MSCDLVKLTQANLNDCRKLDTALEKVKNQALSMTDEALTIVLTQSRRISEWVESVQKALKEAAIEKAKAKGFDGKHCQIETDAGLIEITAKETTVLIETEAQKILSDKGLLEECTTKELDMEKIKKLKKANVITNEEWLKITVSGEPTYAVSIK